MLNSLSITNYRCFERYQMNKLTRVNLLVGRNNTGKSTLLEAIEFLASGGNPEVLMRTAAQRGEEDASLRRETRFSALADISHFFFGHKIQPESQFTVASDNGLPAVTVSIEPLTEDNRQPELFEDSQNTPPMFTLRIARAASANPIDLLITENGTLLMDPRRPGARYTRPENNNRMVTCLISPNSLLARSMARQWNQVLTDSREQEVIAALQLLEPDISEIVFLPGESPLRNPGAGILVGLAREKRRLPLGSLGDGIRRMLALAISLIQAKDGILLVDEIENGFHFSVMEDMWKLVIRTAVASNIQIFATTHSLDCVRGLAALLRRDPALETEVSLQNIDRSLPQSIPYGGGEIAIAAEMGIEVRR